MNQEITLLHRNAWIYSFSAIVNITELRNFKNVDLIRNYKYSQGIEIYNVMLKTPNNHRIEDVMDAIKLNNISKAKQIIDEIQNSSTQIIAFPEEKICIFLCKDITKWNFAFEDKKTKFNPINIMSKEYFIQLLDSNCISNVLEISFDEISVSNNLTTLKGNNIEGSDIFEKMIAEENLKLLSYTYKYKDSKFLISINTPNQIEFSKTMEIFDVIEYLQDTIKCGIGCCEVNYGK